MAGLLEVGRVVRAHGLRGQVVVELWTNRQERVAEGSVLQAQSRDLKIARASPMAASGGRERWLISFEGVSDRNAAESLRDQVLRAAPISDPGALWVHELVGSEVFDSQGKGLGVVEAVEANPASDLLVLDGGELVPLRFVTGFSAGRVTVDVPPGLLEPRGEV